MRTACKGGRRVNYKKEVFVEYIKNAGVVGAGGAGFPTHVKVDAKADYVILNAAECEPLLRVDQQLIDLYTDEIIEALSIITKAVGAKKAFIGIKRKHSAVISNLSKKISGKNKIEIFQLEDFYPAGDEQVLVYEITKRVVPENSIPLKVGCIVINVETVLNIFNSLDERPVNHTYVTITGEVNKPSTLKLPIGITIREALELADIKDGEDLTIIEGGPMMGNVVLDWGVPITKTTKGLIALKSDSYIINRKKLDENQALRMSKAACLQCRMCTDMCPRYLLGHRMYPHLTMRKSNYDREGTQGAEISYLCSECAVCELYACPAGLSPRLINIHYKKKLRENQIKYTSFNEEFHASALNSMEYRKIPVKRLISRLGLDSYDVDAPIYDIDYKPKVVNIPLKQHIGQASIPTVKIGQKVEEGELIGDIPKNSIGAKVHSSIDGKVVYISDVITIESI